MPEAFEARSENLDGPVRRIAVIGELDLGTAPELEKELWVARDGNATAPVVIDLSDCDFIDSSGLALIIQAWRELEAKPGVSLALCCATEQVERLLRITGADEAITIYDSLDDALAALR
ncbi:MAG TPA: STAS domain-containing protein [Solirubrobacterales bacterium]|nr:STAS domain-containing protein [Solirubrobacterales bacterium]